MKYFSLNCVNKAYALVSKETKDKFWGILAILYSIDNIVKPNISYNIDAVKLSSFLENTFRLKDKKNYENSNSEYSVVFSFVWVEKTIQNFLIGSPDIVPIIVWAYRRHSFSQTLSISELIAKFVSDFHISKEVAEDLFSLEHTSLELEFADSLYDDIQLLKLIKGEAYDINKTTLKMGTDVAVANAGDLSRGPFFQPLYASLNTLECLTIYPFNVNDYYISFQEGSFKEKTVLSLEEQFLKYLESNNLSERTIDRYYKQTPNKSEVKAIIKETFNKNSLFEIDSVEDATVISQKVRIQNFDIVGKNMYSSGINKYIEFLEWLYSYKAIKQQNVRESFIKYWNIIDQHGAQFELYVNRFESVINAEIKNLKIGVSDVFEIVDFEQYKQLLSQIISNNPDLAYLNDDTGPDGAKYYIWSTNRHYRNYLNILAVSDFFEAIREEKTKVVSRFSETVGFDKDLLTAMRTKPFLLLAGISGTGKSRIVKQMAFESCPDIEELRSDKTSPGNYQLIEVKPNWHDSTEVLGYESEIGGKHYVATPFVKFLVKAMCYEDNAPFFVCMDEMNLAPVEQYFAEFLSVLESRKLVDGKITSEPLIKADVFKKYETQLRADLQKRADDEQTSYGENATSDPIIEYSKFNEIYEHLKVEGLRIPSNLIVVGTVNMDETTHQFSRKVIDRAMTIEMNIEDAEDPFVNFFKDCKDLDYSAAPQAKELFLPTVVQAKEAMGNLSVDDTDYLIENVPTLLHGLNQALNGTPFKIAYRVQNELVLYFHELRKEQPESAAEELLKQAMDSILMLKVLPRIEGDEDLLEKPLEKLHKFTEDYTDAHKKVEEMQTRLNGGHFTSFWP